MTYQAIVSKISVRPHPNADRLALGVCHGFQVVVGSDTQSGQLGVFFPTDGILERSFCEANDLFPRYDEQGNRIGGGFFDIDKPRVRAQGFRGEKSFGFFCPLSHLAYTKYDISKLKEGDTFTELNGVKVCDKYVNERTRQARDRKGVVSSRRETTMFRRHFETEQWRFFRNTIETGDRIIVTLKMHGTSQRFGLVQEQVKFNWWQRFVSRFVPLKDRQWTRIVGTRNVIITDESGGYYGDESFRFRAIEGIPTHKGEVIYGEIVGYVDENKTIMPPASTSSIKDKGFSKRYGNTMRYTYGCQQGECALYVYRITQVNEDGVAYELPWTQVKARCNQLGVRHVPELQSLVFDGDLISFDNYLETVVDGEDVVDSSHIREGVCIRVERGLDTRIFKHKSFQFLVLEGVAKDSGEVDTEESA
jgi:hypothetical protein